MMASSSPVSSAGLQALLDALPDAVLTTDSAGNTEFLNRAAEQLTGHTRETVVGRPLGQILPLGSESDGTPLESLAAICLRGQATVGPFEARLLNGGEGTGRVLNISVSPVRDAGGTTTGAILIARDVTHAHQVTRQLAHEATHDPLTGLVNRAEFERRLARALASAAEAGAQHALGLLDLDGFKRINDACGHLAGDEVLRQLSEVLRRRVRGRDTVARLGGDEFGILLEHCSPGRAARIAEHVRRSIRDHRFTCGPETYSVGASIGIVPVQGHSSRAAEVLRAADGACYLAKRQGGDRVQLCTDIRSGTVKQPVMPLHWKETAPALLRAPTRFGPRSTPAPCASDP
jgi:diguanylate cyclase (GGDEF)-like protein/PAS domain S-box-containing protein